MIPQIVYQTWFEKTLPPVFQRIVDKNKRLNPEYKFQLYDNQDLIHLFESVHSLYPTISRAFFRLNPR